MDLKYLIAHWSHVRAGLITTIDKFQNSELDFKPFPGSWSVRQIMMHIAWEEDGEFNYGIVQTLSDFPPEYPLEEYPDCESIKGLLDSVHAPVMHYLEEFDEDELSQEVVAPWGNHFRLIEMFGHMIEHEIHHRSELSLILGVLGREGLNA